MYAAEDLEELITCSICLEKMTQPKMLPCQHTFCLSCLLGLEPRYGYLSCPQCRRSHEIPYDGIKAFSDNYLINNLLSLPSIQPESGAVPRKYKCRHCDNTVTKPGSTCKTCADDPRLPVIEKIQKSLTMMKDHLNNPDVINDLKRNETFLAGIDENLVSEKANVSLNFDQMMEALEKRKASLNEMFERGQSMQKLVVSSAGDKVALDKFFKEISDELASKPELAQLNLLDTECCKYLNWFKLLTEMIRNKTKFCMNWTKPDWSAHNGVIDVNVILEWFRTMGNLSHGTAVPCAPFEEAAPADTIPRSASSSSLPTQTIPQPQPEARPVRSTSTNSINNAPTATAGTVPVQRRLSQPNNQNPVNYHAKTKAKPKFIKLRQERRPLQWPSGVAYTSQTDTLVCADTLNDRVVRMRQDGSPVQTYALMGPSSVLSRPWDAAISEQHGLVLIADTGNNRIVCQDMQGNQKYTTGSHGRGKDKFLSLRGITCHNDFLFAVDEGNNRISVFKIPDGSFNRNFGQKHLKTPQHIAIGENRDIYVTDDGPGEVLVFDWNGRLLRSFGKRAELSDLAGKISGITVDRQGFACVARPALGFLDVYDPSGRHYATIMGQIGFDTPQGLELMPNGRIIVCEAGGNQLQII